MTKYEIDSDLEKLGINEEIHGYAVWDAKLTKMFWKVFLQYFMK